jgi:hypothetical protein
MKTGKQYAGSLIVLLVVMLSGLRVYSQTWSYTYKCTITGIPPDHQKIKSDSSSPGNTGKVNDINELLGVVPFTINTTYEIISDGKYMIVNARVQSSTTENLGIKVNSSDDEEAIIDIKGKLIFFTRSKVIRRLKVYTLDSGVLNSGECRNNTVREKGADYKVAVCKSLPPAIIPPIMFNNREYGIKSIHVPQISIELSSYQEIKKDKKLSECPQYFKQYPISDTEEGFFEQ